jgi:hypothetical protein
MRGFRASLRDFTSIRGLPSDESLGYFRSPLRGEVDRSSLRGPDGLGDSRRDAGATLVCTSHHELEDYFQNLSSTWLVAAPSRAHMTPTMISGLCSVNQFAAPTLWGWRKYTMLCELTK